MVENKTFRQDLYYRINLEHGLQIKSIEGEVFQLFYQHPWPGNVRELEHVIERAAVTCKGTVLKKTNFSFFINKNVKKSYVSAAEQTDSGDQYFLSSQRDKAEKDAIIQALRQTSGNKTKAAQILRIDRSRLYSKLKKYNID